MFEITRENEDAFAFYKNERIAYPNGEYDCTFEGRFLIYHCQQRNEIAYIAIDMQTGQSSEVCHRKEEIPSEQGYESLIPNILSAIKYTGARDKYNPFAEAPLKTIDNVFRYIMPQYGYAVRELGYPRPMNRKHWSYLKTCGCRIIGNLSSTDIATIQGIYDNGITTWASLNEVGNYGLDNREGVYTGE